MSFRGRVPSLLARVDFARHIQNTYVRTSLSFEFSASFSVSRSPILLTTHNHRQARSPCLVLHTCPRPFYTSIVVLCNGSSLIILALLHFPTRLHGTSVRHLSREKSALETLRKTKSPLKFYTPLFKKQSVDHFTVLNVLTRICTCDEWILLLQAHMHDFSFSPTCHWNPRKKYRKNST